jgi:hypothetical protein
MPLKFLNGLRLENGSTQSNQGLLIVISRLFLDFVGMAILWRRDDRPNSNLSVLSGSREVFAIL